MKTGRMKHDARCEWRETDRSPHCRCAERAFLTTATDDERTRFHNRTGYDHNNADQGAA